jgi:hypothetical protein
MYVQLLIRQHLLYRLDAWREPFPSVDDLRDTRLTDVMEREASIVFDNPITTLQSLQAHGLKLQDIFHLACFYTDPKHTTCVWQPNVSQLVGLFEEMLLKIAARELNIDTSPRALFLRYGVASSAKRDAIVEDVFRRRAEWKQLPRGHGGLDQIAESWNETPELLLVNADAPKGLLTTQFLRWVAAWESRESFDSAKPFPELDWNPTRKRGDTSRPCQITVESIIKYNVIPYIDLLIWERLTGCEVSPTLKKDLLYPELEANFKRRIHPKKKISKKATVKHAETDDDYPDPRNLLTSAATQALSLMVINSPSSLLLIAQASEKLSNAYDSGRGDERFVPSLLLVAELNEHWDAMTRID